MSYLDADGHSKYAVVHYPADYQKGKAYPTVFIIYEDFFDDTFDVAANILVGARLRRREAVGRFRDRLSRARRGSRASPPRRTS